MLNQIKISSLLHPQSTFDQRVCAVTLNNICSSSVKVKSNHTNHIYSSLSPICLVHVLNINRALGLKVCRNFEPNQYENHIRSL